MDKTKWTSAGILGVVLVAASLAAAEMPRMAPILTDVETAFGTYRPQLVTVAPNLGAPVHPWDLSAVENLADFDFGNAERGALERQGLFLAQSGHRQIYQQYRDAKEKGLPIFVTTDGLLHTFHVVYDYALRVMEARRFSDDLKTLSEAMLARMASEMDDAEDQAVGDVLRKNVAYFSVALSLLDPDRDVPGFVQQMVREELALIDSHEGFSPSPIFGETHEEDYSQYVPRGHYTRSEALGRFFRAMMWYGRMDFRLKKLDGSPNREETLGAMLIARALGSLMVWGRPALALWDRIYEPTVFFVGKADDLTAREYLGLLASTYGPDYLTMEADAMGDTLLVDRFVVAAEALRDPLIISTSVDDTAEDPEASTKGFRFMGQRFVPDSYMFQQLVYDKVGTRSVPRLFPRGLDVMAVLGSAEAFGLLDEVYGETAYLDYRSQMGRLQNRFGEMTAEAWAQNLYWNWLYCLLPLLEPRGEGYPAFMRGVAWSHKSLNTALGSWAELRHDTILYAKQSYTVRLTSADPPDPFLRGYVEPSPDVFGRLASLAALMRDGLSQRELLLDEFAGKLADFQDLCLALKAIAEKELVGIDRTDAEYALIWDIGSRLEGLVTFSEAVSEEVSSTSDEDMAVIADVHTDPNTEQVLEVGVGRPMALYVVVDDGRNVRVMAGGVFSYQEFRQPMGDRLTDETWQDMLDRGDSPGLSRWMSDLTVGGAVESEPSRPAVGTRVDFSVFVAFARSYGTSSGDGAFRSAFDFDGSGRIDFTDLQTFAGYFNRTVYWFGE